MPRKVIDREEMMNLVAVAGDDVGGVGGAGRAVAAVPLAAEAEERLAASQHVLGGGPPHGHRALRTVAGMVPRLPRSSGPAGGVARRRRASTEGGGGGGGHARRRALDPVVPEERVVQRVLLVPGHAVDGVAVHALRPSPHTYQGKSGDRGWDCGREMMCKYMEYLYGAQCWLVGAVQMLLDPCHLGRRW